LLSFGRGPMDVIREFEVANDVNSIAFSHDGRRLFFVDDDGKSCTSFDLGEDPSHASVGSRIDRQVSGKYLKVARCPPLPTNHRMQRR